MYDRCRKQRNLKMGKVLNKVTYKYAKFNHKIINIYIQVNQSLGSISNYAEFTYH
ncbi:hypothetical protein MtrunA17_Chr1g0189191 [Medicago truncatula]|uniref:Uncharacterized protein n=1 Tax=Medicago truncatula TaxID=3880 RepID=A0A396JUR9_MEDTR|nr:hypothetical protein MtrunA17_Chr1g0189191 [Medicago truncatula]